ncbi:MAG TPA: type IV toxin-antitoxin system AbiEi family antitoxin domain-containing protein, partial [Actinomycetota bacterium]|nr:type IV toxin-antitoxin system AbiEi family antitoxin domain-containing protein [Actinomycetota bacterium]
MQAERERILKLCDRVAAGQHGLITTTQATEAGLSAQAVRRLCRSGRWCRVLPGVYQVSGLGDRWKRDVTALGLWLGDDGAIS